MLDVKFLIPSLLTLVPSLVVVGLSSSLQGVDRLGSCARNGRHWMGNYGLRICPSAVQARLLEIDSCCGAVLW